MTVKDVHKKVCNAISDATDNDSETGWDLHERYIANPFIASTMTMFGSCLSLVMVVGFGLMISSTIVIAIGAIGTVLGLLLYVYMRFYVIKTKNKQYHEFLDREVLIDTTTLDTMYSCIELLFLIDRKETVTVRELDAIWNKYFEIIVTSKAGKIDFLSPRPIV